MSSSPSSLYSFAKSGDIDGFVNFIMNEKGRINHIDEKTQETPILTAATFGHSNIIRYLLDQPGINISYQHPKTGENALHRAAIGGHLDVVKDLTSDRMLRMPLFETFLNATCTLNQQQQQQGNNFMNNSNAETDTALSLAIQNRNADVALHLLSSSPALTSLISVTAAKRNNNRGDRRTLLHMILDSFSSISEKDEVDAITAASLHTKSENSSNSNNKKSISSVDPEEKENILRSLFVKNQQLSSSLLDKVLAIDSIQKDDFDLAGLAPIHKCVILNNIPALRTLVCDGCNLEAKTKADYMTPLELIKHLRRGDDMMKALQTPPLPFEKILSRRSIHNNNNNSSSRQQRGSTLDVGDVFRAFPVPGFVQLMELCDSTLLYDQDNESALSSEEKIDLALYVENLCNNNDENNNSEDNDINNSDSNNSDQMKTIKYFVKTLLTNQNDFSVLHPARVRCGKESISDDALDEAISVAVLVNMVTKIAQGHGIERSNLFRKVLLPSSDESSSGEVVENEWHSFVEYACTELKLIADNNNNEELSNNTNNNNQQENGVSFPSSGSMMMMHQTPSMLFKPSTSSAVVSGGGMMYDEDNNNNQDGNYNNSRRKSSVAFLNNMSSSQTETAFRDLSEENFELKEDIDIMRQTFISDNYLRIEINSRNKISTAESRDRIEIIMSDFQSGLIKLLTSSSTSSRQQQQQQQSSSSSTAAPKPTTQHEEDHQTLRDALSSDQLIRGEEKMRFEIIFGEKDELLEIVQEAHHNERLMMKQRTAAGGVDVNNSRAGNNETTSSSTTDQNTPASIMMKTPIKPSDENGAPRAFQRGRPRLVGTQLIVDSSSPTMTASSPTSNDRSSSPAANDTNTTRSLPRDENQRHAEASVVSQEIMSIEELLRGEAITEEALRLQFEALDRNRSGFLEKGEFRRFFCEESEDFGLEISEWQFENMWWKICGKTVNKLSFSRFALFMLKRAQM